MTNSATIFLLAMSASAATLPEVPLMPMPSHVERHDGALAIDGAFHIAICGSKDPFLDRAVTRFAASLQKSTGLIFLSPSTADCARATMALECERVVTQPALGDDESYTLEITPLSAHLRAPTSTGILRGLATFEQMVQPGATSFTAPAVSIDDHPRFAWRGLMLDASRHWMPVEVVQRNIEAMALVKLNVFHWHLSDDQGFRVESRLYPKLQGAGSDGSYYTQQQIRDVVQFAADRGIRVVPEFDIPGHTTAWLVGYPELASAPGPYEIERKWGVHTPLMDASRESTYTFLDRFIGEMVELFPDAYFHTGGDEAVYTHWKASPAIQEFMRAHAIKTESDLQTYFSSRVEALVEKHGRKMIGWDEILAPGLPKGSVIQSWRGTEALADAARRGYDVLLSNGYYLDHLSPASLHYANDPLGGKGDSLRPEEAKHVLGGEACMWSEYVNAETVDSRTWPRLAAVAERLWSPASVRDAESMYSRLDAVSAKLERTGIEFRSAQPRLLARISGGRIEPALSTLAASIDGLGLGDRQRTHKYTSLVPLNGLADAALPDSPYIHRLTATAHRAVAGDSASRETLRAAFRAWKTSATDLEPLARRSFLAADVLPVARVLSDVGDCGLKTLQFLETNKKPTAVWLTEQKSVLDRAAKPVSEVRVAAATVVRVLLDSITPQ